MKTDMMKTMDYALLSQAICRTEDETECHTTTRTDTAIAVSIIVFLFAVETLTKQENR